MERLLKSFTRPDVAYRINKEDGHCSCNGFADYGWCKHLHAVGQYQPKHVTLSARPSYSQALSGLVKCIRIRDVAEGAYWLNYLWGFREKLAGSQYRTVRRLLIGSAEDGHSIAVMEKVAENFGSLLAKDVQFLHVLTELVRICKVPNWWHPDSGGHDYIYSGMIASRQMLYDNEQYALETCLTEVAKAIEEQDKIAALYWTLKGCDSGKGAGSAMAHGLLGIALTRKHNPAIRLMRNIYLRQAKALHDDTNFIGMAAWLLAGGKSPVIDQIETVTQGEVRRLLERVEAMASHVIPEWCCDGVHCAGHDIRYCGMWDRMYAVCRQFKHYQRVSPEDTWLEDEFYSLEGLLFHQDEIEDRALTQLITITR